MAEINALIIGIDNEYYTILQGLLSRCTDNDYHLNQVPSFAEAIQAIEKTNPDVLLIASSCGIDHYREFIKMVQQNDCLQPVIILETDPENNIEFDYLENGADFYLDKWDNTNHRLKKAIMAGIERVKGFQAIRDSEQRMRGIFYWSSIGIVLLDLEDLIVQHNPAFSRIVGFSDDELCDMPLLEELIHADNREQARQALERIKKQEQPVAKLQCLLRTSKEEYTWVELTLSLFSETGTSAQFCVCLVEDIADKKRMEAELRQSEIQLKQLSAHLLDLLEQERRHIARELHDSIGSYLGAIKLAHEQLGQTVPASKKDMAEKTVQITGMVIETMNELQRITSNLYPAILDDLGVVAALRWHVERMNSTLPSATIQLDAGINESRLHPELPIVIFRVCQEAIYNALKHSQSVQIAVTLKEKEGIIVLAIADAGVGLPGTQPGCDKNQCGMGIRNMMKRVEFSGGLFSISSKPGQGTVVEASWPVFMPSE